MYTVKHNSKYGEKLIEMNFSPNLCASPNDCEDWYNHCKEKNMVFLKGSYGTLVHKDFTKYFQRSKTDKTVHELLGIPKSESFGGLDHQNKFYFKPDSSIKMITSSPYNGYAPYLFQGLKYSDYSLYVIHPNLLDYYAFVCRTDSKYDKHPLAELNYAFLKKDDADYLNEFFKDELNMYWAFVLLRD